MSAVPVPKKKLTEAEYLAIENAAEFKSEFFDGVMYPLHWDGITAMAGANPFHNRIKENLIVELGIRFGDGPCQSYSSDQRVRLNETGMYAYPDIVVICEPPIFLPDEKNTLANAQVVIEVVSPSTEGYEPRVQVRPVSAPAHHSRDRLRHAGPVSYRAIRPSAG